MDAVRIRRSPSFRLPRLVIGQEVLQHTQASTIASRFPLLVFSSTFLIISSEIAMQRATEFIVLASVTHSQLSQSVSF
jgi:hypothetical protein